MGSWLQFIQDFSQFFNLLSVSAPVSLLLGADGGVIRLCRLLGEIVRRYDYTCRSGWLADTGAKEPCQSLLQRLFHNYLIFIGDNHPLELRNFACISFEVQRSDIKEGFFNWDSEKGSLNDGRTALIP